LEALSDPGGPCIIRYRACVFLSARNALIYISATADVVIDVLGVFNFLALERWIGAACTRRDVMWKVQCCIHWLWGVQDISATCWRSRVVIDATATVCVVEQAGASTRGYGLRRRAEYDMYAPHCEPR